MSLLLLVLALVLGHSCSSGVQAASTPWVFPGEAVPPHTLRVTTLGSGSPDVRREQVASGFLIELGNGEKFIFDLGSGSYMNLVASGVSQGELTKVFLTHLHSDHIADLASLYVGAMFGRTQPWEVWGPSCSEGKELGLTACIEGLRKFLAWDTHARRKIDMVERTDHGDEVIAHEFDFSVPQQTIYSRGGVIITSTPVNHYNTSGPVALRLEWEGLSVTYSGDTTPTDTLRELAEGSDLLLLQNMGPVMDVPSLPYASQYLINTSHITCQQAGTFLASMPAPPRLTVLHHLVVNDASRSDIISQVRANYAGPITINEDLSVFEVTKPGVALKKRLVPNRTWGAWHAENNWNAVQQSFAALRSAAGNATIAA